MTEEKSIPENGSRSSTPATFCRSSFAPNKKLKLRERIRESENIGLVYNPKKVIVAGNHVSFEDVLSDEMCDPFNLKHFGCFLRQEFAFEHLSFWADVKDLQLSPDEEVKSTCKFIIDEYISAGASQEINVSSHTRKEILRRFDCCYGAAPSIPRALRDDVARALFQQGVEEVYALMEKDNFPRFQKAVQIKISVAALQQNALFWKKNAESLGPLKYSKLANLADTKVHSLLNSILILSYIISSHLSHHALSFGIGIYLGYGYVIRTFSGPKFSPEYLLVMFYLSPLAVRFNLAKVELVACSPYRWVECFNFCGALVSLSIFHHQPPMLVIWVFLVIMNFSLVFLNFHIAFFLYISFVKLGWLNDSEIKNHHRTVFVTKKQRSHDGMSLRRDDSSQLSSYPKTLSMKSAISSTNMALLDTSNTSKSKEDYNRPIQSMISTPFSRTNEKILS